MTLAGGGVQVAKHKLRRFPHHDTVKLREVSKLDEIMMPGSAEPPRGACNGLQTPSVRDWREVRLVLELATGVLAADAEPLAARLAALPPGAPADSADALDLAADALDDWTKIAREAADRMRAIVNMEVVS